MAAEDGAGIFGRLGDDEPAAEGDPAHGDPSRAFARPAARRQAFEAWVAAGRPWPPEPAGMLGAIAGAALGQGRGR